MSKKGKKKQGRKSPLYSILHTDSDIQENRDIDVLERNRNLQLLLGTWTCIYCSAKIWTIRKITFNDKNHFTIHLKFGPITIVRKATYVLQLEKMYISIMHQLFEVDYGVSDKMLTAENEIVKVMYVKAEKKEG